MRRSAANLPECTTVPSFLEYPDPVLESGPRAVSGCSLPAVSVTSRGSTSGQKGETPATNLPRYLVRSLADTVARECPRDAP